MIRPRVLIEDWLPIAEIGVESLRENSTGKHPPPNRFHVWWARRPLMASRAAVLASLLPSWSEDWSGDLRDQFLTEEHYREWFVQLLGVRGDPMAARERLRWANERGIKLNKAYEGPRAFTISPDAEQIAVLRRLLEYTWGVAPPIVLDPMAGGGSIPFESLRFGFQTRANELNPVASFVLQGTLALPARLGPGFAEEIAKWGDVWAKRVEKRLNQFFPRQPGESIQAYVFARTIACPDTGKMVPLAPNWWLRRGSDSVAVRLVARPDAEECQFELVRGDSIDFDPDIGTVRRGEGRSPWTGATMPGDYIKAEAQAGRMGVQMYAVATKGSSGHGFRLPSKDDLAALHAADEALHGTLQAWITSSVVPGGDIGDVSNYDRGHRMYGIERWIDFFSPRQLLVIGAMAEELRTLSRENSTSAIPNADDVVTALAFAFDKALVHNTIACRWDGSRRKVVSFFDKHNYEFKWAFAEYDGAHNLLPWAVKQIVDTYRELAKLVEPTRSTLSPEHAELASDLLEIHQGDAASLPYGDQSVQTVVVDPPYYDNVQYAELSDFFYVWDKLTVGHIYPEFFSSDLTDKTAEAVANAARFKALDKKRAKELAKADYEKKMTRVFAEAHRVLREDGVLTVMFTHKKVEAWDTLGNSLIEAGFEIESSWPVHTESEHSLHQAKKAAAASTILLACRKRTADREAVWWDDLKAEVRRVAREKAEEFSAAGIEGVDLYISTFGPTLSVISRQWPVFTSEVDPDTGKARPLRPEEALDLAREEVADLRRRGLLLGRDVEFDPITDWYVLAWDAFRAVEFPYDEARKLAFVLGLDLEGDLVKARVVSKKGSSVSLQEPKQRRRPGLADPEEASFVRVLDAAHALIVAYQEDGIRGAEGFLRRTRLASDGQFQALLQALINAIPRTKQKGTFIRPEAAALDGIVAGLADVFPDLQVPPDPQPVVEPAQGTLSLDSET